MPYRVLQGGERRRAARRRRRRRRAGVLACAVVLAMAAALALAGGGDRGTRLPNRILATTPPGPLAGGGTAPLPVGINLSDPVDAVQVPFKTPPRAGLLFDVDTGRVLWRRNPTRVLPMASLTKMMTALVVTGREAPDAKVKVTKAALAYKGSGVGVLPRGKRIKLETMLNGLLLPSGNDAAIALAQRTAGTVARFVALMNDRADALGLACTRFSSPDGFEDAGNHSCAADLASMAISVLRTPRLARIVKRRRAFLPFPIKGGHIYLYNNNPLIRQGYPGVNGVKTGYTDAAGRCLVASARRNGVALGVVLLHSPDPAGQARRLLNRGFLLAGAAP
jgi:D-alanyl-D-alanine carboxypeptidase